MNPENATVVKLERIGWSVVKIAFVALVLMLVLTLLELLFVVSIRG